MKGKSFIAVLVLVIVAAVIGMSVFTVDERETAIVFEFGKVVEVIERDASGESNAGLYFKKPIINDVRFYDGRMHTLDSHATNYLTVQKKNLIVDSFVKWRIADTEQFFITVKNSRNASNRLLSRIDDSLRSQFSIRRIEDAISGDRAEIMDAVRSSLAEEARAIGVDIIDVRLKRVDYSTEISESVYGRMEAEREREAKKLRAEGDEQANIIRAEAERDRQILLAKAEEKAEQIRGEGDAKATEVYADAFSKDAEFYNLYRSLDAYRKTFAEQGGVIVMDPSSEFFKYFKSRGTQPTGSENPLN